MKNKLKARWMKIQNFFRNSLNRLFSGVILLIFAVLLRTGIVAHYLGLYPSIILGIIWIIVAIFYFIMYLWAISTR